ncbi:hypothetical protein OXX69_000202 [Metschnikowia pulcherrima]
MKAMISLFFWLAVSCAMLIPISDPGSMSEVASSSHSANPTKEAIQESASIETHEATDQGSRSYIVVLKDGYEKEEYEAHNDWVANEIQKINKRDLFCNVTSQEHTEPEFFNVSSFKGYSGYIPSDLISTVNADPMVAFIEEDSMIHADGISKQKDAPWGLARVSHRDPAQPSVGQYLYDEEGGRGVTAYVLDTGVKTSHPDFEGRASCGKLSDKTCLDDNGHGSHIAGTIAGKTYGIAKKVDLVALKVLDANANGKVSDAIKGLEYAAQMHKAKVAAKEKGYKGSVVNLSASGKVSKSIELAVNAAIAAGLHVVVTAGNNNVDACNISPARASGPITVAATNDKDKKAGFSNWGKCVDIFAPGEAIKSVGLSDNAQYWSGTSMAAPHVTGLLSYFLSLQPEHNSEYGSKLISPADLKKRFIQYGTRNMIGGIDDATPNVLAYNGAGNDLSDFWN